MDCFMSADTPTNEELLEAARAGDEAALVEHHRGRLERMVLLRMDRRLQGRVDPADIAQEAYLALRAKFARYGADPQLPSCLWLRSPEPWRDSTTCSRACREASRGSG